MLGRVHGGLVWDRVRVVSVTPHGMSWCEISVETGQDHPVGLAGSRGSMEIPETVGRGVVGPMTAIINAWVIAVELAETIFSRPVGTLRSGLYMGLSGYRGVHDEKNGSWPSDAMHYEIGQVTEVNHDRKTGSQTGFGTILSKHVSWRCRGYGYRPISTKHLLLYRPRTERSHV